MYALTGSIVRAARRMKEVTAVMRLQKDEED
jgi:hypothetical protein